MEERKRTTKKSNKHKEPIIIDYGFFKEIIKVKTIKNEAETGRGVVHV